jgi:hypothetical protein
VTREELRGRGTGGGWMNPIAGKKYGAEANWPRAVWSILPMLGKLAFKRKLYTGKSTIERRKYQTGLSIFVNKLTLKKWFVSLAGSKRLFGQDNVRVRTTG